LFLWSLNFNDLESGFEIKLPQFEGPFDLLLFFIERDELDIYNIPIASITNDFLDYIREIKELNMEVASEFILVAATLMRIKVRLLLPRPEKDEDGNEIDPRQDLVAQLLEYKRYKTASDEMKQMEDERIGRERRGNIAAELSNIASNGSYSDELNNLTLYKLLETFEKVMSRFEKEAHKPIHTIVQYQYTIQGEKEEILRKINEKGKATFIEFLESCKDRYHIIFTFMAILEMLAEQVVEVTIGIGFNNFWITARK
jgi:segregation and condensation protein A